MALHYFSSIIDGKESNVYNKTLVKERIDVVKQRSQQR